VALVHENWNLGMLIFAEGGKPENLSGEKPSKQGSRRINNKLNSHMIASPGIKPGSQWVLPQYLDLDWFGVGTRSHVY
jgi:hypothetical protein